MSIICVSLSGCAEQADEKEAERSEAPVIHKIIPWEMGFLAVGDDGMFLTVSAEGEAQRIETEENIDFQTIWSGNNTVFIAGEDGKVFRCGEELQVSEEKTGYEGTITAGACFKDKVFCGGEDGTLLVSEENGTWTPLELMIQGDVAGMAASDGYCLLVTDEGETAVTEDGSTWSVLDYADYYQKDVAFDGLLYDGTNFWAYGKDENGTKLFYTDTGSVWAERDINYLEGEDEDLSGLQIQSVVSDGEQLYAWCDDGLYTFPDCVQCNKKTDVKELEKGAVGYNGGKLLIAEDAEHVTVMDTEAAKQYKISPETAYQKQQEGAVLIDVRSEEEHKEKAIKGSISLPVDEVEERLPEMYPDLGQTIIFYCAKGIRSQTAVERARELGYVEVYTMGGMDGWQDVFELE